MQKGNSPRIVQPKGWRRPSGYANGMAASGETVFVAGQVGWNAEQAFESDDFVAQVRQALRNVLAVVDAAGGGAENIVRLVWYVVDKHEYRARLAEVGEAYRSVMGRHFPTMTLVEVKSLLEDAAKIEIEATAVLPP